MTFNVKKHAILLSAGIFAISAIAVLSYSAVDNSLTEEDKAYMPMYLSGIAPLPENPTYTDELNFIRSVQHSVLNITSGDGVLPHNHKRGLKEVYKAKKGACYDRSRVIEKILRFSHFKTRQVSLFSEEKTGSAIVSLLTRGVTSHSVSEILTKNGWLVVDSNVSWVSIDKNKQPVSMQRIHYSVENSVVIKWNSPLPTKQRAFPYNKPFVYVYGLYARHGEFYPPYNAVPDINYGEFIQNLSDIPSYIGEQFASEGV